MKLIIALVFTFIFSSLSSQTIYQPQDMFADMREGDRAVVVAIHSGVADENVRQRTTERFNERLRNEFSQCEFREAWTSRSEIRKLEHTGKFMLTPAALFTQLRKEGFTHVLVQTSCVVECTDMAILREDVKSALSDFKVIRLGTPLLSDPQNCTLASLATAATFGSKRHANVFVCTSTGNPMADAAYSMLDCTVRDSELGEDFYVTTIDGFPAFENLIKRLKKAKAKRVNLIPFSFVPSAENMAIISEQWVNQLTEAGFKVDVSECSIAEIDGILDIFVGNARTAQQMHTLSPLEIKTKRMIGF